MANCYRSESEIGDGKWWEEEDRILAGVRRLYMSPAHAKALYPSIASGDAIIRRARCACEIDSNCESVSIAHLLVVALAGG